MVEYRPFPDDREDEFHEFTAYAFSPEDGPYDPDEHEDRPTIVQRRGLFDADDPVAVCGHHHFQLRIRGEDRRVGGLSAVASPPEHRRQGYVKRLLRESIAEYRDDGIAFSVLWPFEYSFYGKYGWATVSQYVLVETPPEQLEFLEDVDGTRDAPGTYRKLDADDFAAAEPVFAAMAERYDFTMARSRDWWEYRTLRGWDTDPFVYGWERDGELRGILRFTFEESGDDRVLKVNDVAFVDETAWLNLLRFCRNHDSQVSEITIRAPPDIELLDRVTDPRAISCNRRTGPMLRLVDVVDAFEQLTPTIGNVEAESFDLVVTDPLVEWNDGRFRVRVRDGFLSADRVDSTEPSTETRPVVEVDVGTLSQLYAGYHSVEEAERLGDLEIGAAGDAGAVRSTLATVFPSRPTHLREAF